MGIFQQFPYSNFHDMNMDEIIKIVRQLADDWAAYQLKWGNLYNDTQQALNDFKAYVEHYWNTLDLTDEVNTVIRKMVAEGSLDSVITTNLSPVVTAWLENNIDPQTSVVIDSSLTIAGAAADAKAAGDVKLAADNLLGSITRVATLENTTGYPLIAPYIISSTGELVQFQGDALYETTQKIPVTYGQLVYYRYARAQYGNQYWTFLDENDHVIKHSGRTTSDPAISYNQLLEVPFKAKYFAVSYDAHNISTSEQKPDVCVITKYNKAVMEYPTPINANIGSYNSTPISGTSYQFHVLTNNAFNIPLDNTEEYSHFYTVKVTIRDFDYIRISNYKAMWANWLWAICDKSGIILAYHENSDYTAGGSMIVKVPKGAEYIIVSGYDDTPIVEKVTSFTLGNTQGAAIDWSNYKWAVIGDSITEVNGRATKRYMDYIKDSSGIDYVNMGISGTGFKNGGADNEPYYSRVSDIPADSDIITIMGSGNDCSLTLGTPTDTGTGTVCGCINKTIDDIRARIVGANIGIIAPTPWVQYPTTNPSNNMAQYCNALKQICERKGIPYLDLYRCSNMLPWEESFREAYYSHDDGNGVHPDENGHKFFAPHIYSFMRSLLMI